MIQCGTTVTGRDSVIENRQAQTKQAAKRNSERPKEKLTPRWDSACPSPCLLPPTERNRAKQTSQSDTAIKALAFLLANSVVSLFCNLSGSASRSPDLKLRNLTFPTQSQGVIGQRDRGGDLYKS